MSHKPAGSTPSPQLRELALAVGLSLLLLTYSAYQLAGQLTSAVFTTSVGRSVLRDFLLIPALRGELAAFAAAQLGLYFALGIAVWLLSIATTQSDLVPATRPWKVVASWWVAVALWIELANVHFFPWSVARSSFSWLLVELIPGVTTFSVVSTLLGGAIVCICAVAAARSRWRRIAVRTVVWGGLTVAAALVLSGLPDSIADNPPAAAPKQPNIVIIGIDSLRSDMSGPNSESWLTPNIDRFLNDARLVPDAITPLARTFPSWISILTGSHPQTTRARENLVPKQLLKLPPTLAERLRSAGYRTVFATDEVRFSNIDTSYGFDAALTPPIGAADFLLGTINDLPLSNLIVNSRLGGLLFPASYANRGAAVTYQPQTFIERLASETDFEDSPLFLAIHLTLPHWPFRWADEPGRFFEYGSEQPYAYLSAVIGVDGQFAELMALLEARGVLTNAVVVLLSDHGEGLGLPVDNLIYSREAKEAAGRLPVAMWGHGTSVLSPHQHGVLLALRGYGPSQFAHGAGVPLDVPATLEDVAPTLLDLAGIRSVGERFDGQSLAALLRGDEAGRATLDSRFRFVETAYNSGSLGRGKLRESELIEEGRFLYRINPDTARLEFRAEQWERLLAAKERAVIQGDWLLAALPAPEANSHRYLLVNRRGGLPKRLESQPDAKQEPRTAGLWQALHARFPGELSDQVAN